MSAPIIDDHVAYSLPTASLRERYIRSMLASSGVVAAITGVATTSQLKALCVATFVAGALMAGRPTRAKVGKSLVLGTYVCLVVVSLARTNYASVFFVSHNAVVREALFVVAAGWFAISALWGETADWERRRKAALLAPGVFVIANLALWAVGFHFGPTPLTTGVPGNAEMLAHLGFNIERQAFPLTPGINGAGVIAAIAGSMSVVLLRGGSSRFVHAAIVGASVTTIGLVDARGSMLFAAITVGAISLTPRFLKRGLSGIPLLMPFLPLILLWLLSTFAGYTSGLSRNGGDAATATGRSIIWQSIYDYLKHLHAADIFGYGYYGQVASGVSHRYAFLFRFQPVPESASAHNLLLQTILDSGYVGAIVLVVLIVAAVLAASRRYAETLSPSDLATVTGLVVLVLAGSTESLPAIYFPYSFILALLLLCVALRLPESAR